jgi:dihydrodipicolinate reductase
VPKVALENLKFYAKNNLKIVMATTGWYKHISEVKDLFKSSN